jgi:hypothetical protein
LLLLLFANTVSNSVAFVYGSVVVGVVFVVAVDSGADYEADERQFVVDGGDGNVAVEHRRFEMRSGGEHGSLKVDVVGATHSAVPRTVLVVTAVVVVVQIGVVP